VTPVPSARPTSFQITNDGSGGSPTAFMQLFCQNAGRTVRIFNGPLTVNPGRSDSRICGAAPNQNFPLVFNSTCGPTDRCQGQ
jgi:hypothetical protein